MARAAGLLAALLLIVSGCIQPAATSPTAISTRVAAPTAASAETVAATPSPAVVPSPLPSATATSLAAPTSLPTPALTSTPSPPATASPPTSTPAASTITAATWVSPDDGWLAVGDSILATDDAGSTWTKRSALGGVRALSFVTLDEGWAATASGLYATQDGGKTWQGVPTGGVADLTRVDFVDPDHGWVVPKPAEAPGQQAILRTTDGGKTWSRVPTPCVGLLDPAAISFYDTASGWLACGGEPGAGNQAKYLYRTDDAGTRWRLVSQTAWNPADAVAPKSLPTSGYVADLHFRDESHGWLATSRGGLLHTSDGGKTWQPLASLYGERFPSGPRFFSEERGYVLDTDGGQTVLLGTSDSGKTWKQLYP